MKGQNNDERRLKPATAPPPPGKSESSPLLPKNRSDTLESVKAQNSKLSKITCSAEALVITYEPTGLQRQTRVTDSR